MNWVTSSYFLFIQFLYLLAYLTRAQLDSDQEREIGSHSSILDGIKSATRKATERAQLQQNINEDQEGKNHSEWFNGPPRLKCEPPPGVEATEDIFMDAHLLECMRNQTYDTSQLPLKSFGRRELLYLRYLFAINNLVDVDKDGKITIVVTFKLVWYFSFVQIDYSNN